MSEVKNKNDIDIEIKRLETEPEVSPPKKRHTYYIKVELHEKVKALAGRKRKNMSEVVNEALDEFFKERQVKEVPKEKEM